MRAKLWLIGLAVALAGCERLTTPSSVPSTGVPVIPVDSDIDEAGNYRDPARSLKTAVQQVYSNECGHGLRDERYQRCDVLINAASKDGLMAAFTAVVNDDRSREWCVGNVSRAAGQLPFSAEFRDALRQRRGSLMIDPSSILGAFDYFVVHGDASDLTWMEGKADKMEERHQKYHAEAVKKMRERLAAEGQ